MTIAIVGSREFNDYELLCKTMERYKPKITKFVSGGAIGADLLGEAWADDNGIPKTIYYPDWERFKKAAGFVRNEAIVRNCDAVVAFWNGKSKGTKHAIDIARKYGKPTLVIKF